MNRKKTGDVLMEINMILKEISTQKNICIDYVRIYWAAMKFLINVFGKSKHNMPINVEKIYDSIGIKISRENMNEFMERNDVKKVNTIIGKISIRPDYITNDSKITVCVEQSESPAMINYALAHELGHFLLNYDSKRYTDDYSTMPMLPKKKDEIVADIFAVFLMIPFDEFLKEFKEYIRNEKKENNVPISTEKWINYLSSIASIPYYYVACAYQQIRHVAYLMYNIHIGQEPIKEYRLRYGEEIMELYDMIKDLMTEETLELLYQ